jgi:hypothetical protein
MTAETSTEPTGPMVMTRGDREQLVSVVKMRARVAKAAVADRQADLLADVERQLSTIYKANEQDWADISASAEAAVHAADQQLAAICRERGIPEEFRPSLHVGWYGRGENADAKRRAELRALATKQIDAAGKKAKLAIERRTAEVLTALVAGTLESSDARVFLESIPMPEALMPTISVKALEVSS